MNHTLSRYKVPHSETKELATNYQPNRLMTFYAINYPAGEAFNGAGDRYGNYAAFSTKTARDEWVNEGGVFRSSPDYREAIKTGDVELRSRLKEADRLMAQGQGYEDSLYQVNIELA